LAITVSVLGAATAFLTLVPLPYHIDCVFTIVPRDAATVVPQLPGQLTEVSVSSGDVVEQGQVLARIDSFEMRVALIGMEGQVREQLARLNTLYQLQINTNSRAANLISGQIGQAEQTLESLREQLEEKRVELRGLEIVAPISGTVLPVPPRQQSNPGDGRLPDWSGSLLDPKNEGATVSPTDLICLIGDPTALDAELVIDQGFIDFILKGQPVELLLEAFPNQPIVGLHVVKIADNPLESIPPTLSGQSGGGLDTELDERGLPKPMNPSYAARVPIENWTQHIQHGMRGKAKIQVERQTLARRLYRYLARTFHFDL
jgi:putative peptide zinc metalloprotease protein